MLVVPPVPPLEVVPPAEVVPPEDVVPPDAPVAVDPPDPPVLPPEPPLDEALPEPPQAKRRALEKMTKGRRSFANMGACSLFVRRESRPVQHPVKPSESAKLPHQEKQTSRGSKSREHPRPTRPASEKAPS